ncbi:MAG TPA: WD40 repeat domain-containing protein [Vicinamibacterales bacterium]|nr:WD40 repeat domain-containing protein [Vicinamibacterales bacterium]
MPPGSTKCAPREPTWTRMPAPRLLINSLDISRDGSRILAGTYRRAYGADLVDGLRTRFGVYCYDAAGKLLRARVIDGSAGVYWVALSADGRYAASGGLVTETTGFFDVFDLETGATLLPQVTTAGRVNRVDLSDDGAVLAACAADTVYVARQTAGAFAAPQTFALGSEAVSVAVSPDGTWVAAVSYDSTVHLFGVSAAGAMAAGSFAYPLQNASGHSVQFSPDGAWFATAHGGGNHGGSFCLFNVAQFATAPGSYWDAPVGVGGSVYSVALALSEGALVPDVAATINASDGGSVVRVRTSGASPATVWSFATARPPNCVAMNPSGSLVAIADGYPENTPGNFYLLDGSGTCRWTCPSGNMNWPIAVAAGTGAVVGGSDDANVYFFTP